LSGRKSCSNNFRLAHLLDYLVGAPRSVSRNVMTSAFATRPAMLLPWMSDGPWQDYHTAPLRVVLCITAKAGQPKGGMGQNRPLS
jgi:hypothetical protein